MTHHSLFTSPVGFDFRAMKAKEARQYCDHFVASIPRRLRELQKVVKSTSGFADWQADLGGGGLRGLSQWLPHHISRRELSSDEKHGMAKAIGGPLGTVLAQGHVELSVHSYSLCIDSSMYVGQVIIHRHPSAAWGVGRGPQKGLYYNRPVVALEASGFVMDPFRDVTNAAFAYLREGKVIDLDELVAFRCRAIV